MYDRYNNRPIDCSGLPKSDNDEECRKTYGFTEWEMIARRERDMAGYTSQTLSPALTKNSTGATCKGEQ